MTKLEELVIEEATKLKQFATTKELSKLNYNTLDGSSKLKCIYGQMTRNCTSDRAYELIQQCCERVYKPNSNSIWDRTLAGKLNGKPKELDTPSDRLDYYVSPIENFLDKNKPSLESKSPKVKQLVAFLKGDVDVLDFKKV